MKLFRKSLAVILALIMICSGLAVGVSADDSTLSLSFTGSVVAKKITATVSGGATDATYTFTISPDSDAISKYPSGTSCDFTNITIGTEYTITVTDGTNTVSKPYTVNKEAKAAPAVADVKYTVASDGKSVTLTLAGAEFTMVKDNFTNAKASSATFTGLTANTTYTFYARYAETDTTLASDAVAVTVVTTYVEAPIPTVGTTTIDVVTVSGVEFAIFDAAGTTLVKDWQTSGTFTGLTASTKYTVKARLAASHDTMASTTCTTLAPNTQTVAAPTMASVTDTTITFTAVDGYEYSVDDGTTFQSSPIFKNLTSGTSYSCVQRMAANGVTSASATSTSLIVTTTNASLYAASISNVAKNSDGTFYTITTTDTIRVNQELAFTVYYDSRSTGTAQWGDTRFVPVSVSDSNGVTGSVGSANDTKRTIACTITPTKKGTDTIFVTYEKQEYRGAEGWKKVDTTVKSFAVTVNVESNSTRDFFVKLFDVLLNTLPTYMTKFVNWLQPIVAKYISGDYSEIIAKLGTLLNTTT